MITTPESNIIDIQVEITKNKKLLDKVYIDTENLKRDKTTIENDIMTASKHQTYLDGMNAQKQKELDEKTSAISGLDQQIIDKSKRRDDLEHDINATETLLKEKKEEIETIIQAIKGHHDALNQRQDEISARHKEAEEKNKKVDDKLDRIAALLEELK